MKDSILARAQHWKFLSTFTGLELIWDKCLCLQNRQLIFSLVSDMHIPDMNR